ncbi:MAG: tRNA (guanosine(37)-N1)-methyltransferase TrmD [Candidatus Roizmanbacteria bacterium]
MRITILTLFPDMMRGILDTSIVGKAQKKGVATVDYIDIRTFSSDSYGSVDDRPYGGGPGMIMKVDVLHAALKSVVTEESYVILTAAGGNLFTQKKARAYADTKKHLVIICGHYEGVDARILTYIHEEVSIGEYVLTGGELPAAIITDAVVRLLPGTFAKEGVAENETYTRYSKEPPQYTRPAVYDGQSVPDVLMGGDHKKIEEWKNQIQKT